MNHPIVEQIKEKITRVSSESNKDFACIAVRIIAARKVSQKELEPYAKKLVGSNNVKLHLEYDSALIAGLIFQTKNQHWDLSMKQQLQSLKQSL